MKTYTELLQESRKKAGLSIRELSRRSGVSVGYIAAIEKGTRNPTIDVLESLFNATGSGLKIGPTVPLEKTYTEAQILQALDAIAAGHSTVKPSNLAYRFQGMVQAATPALLADLADAFAVVASKHPGELGVFVQSLAAEVLAESYARQTARSE